MDGVEAMEIDTGHPSKEAVDIEMMAGGDLMDWDEAEADTMVDEGGESP